VSSVYVDKQIEDAKGQTEQYNQLQQGHFDDASGIFEGWNAGWSRHVLP